MNRLKVLLSLVTHNDYEEEQAAVAQATAQKLNLNLTVIYADGESVKQSLQVVQAIQKVPELRPDAIVVEPVGTGMPQVANAAAAAGIGWVVLNKKVDYVSRLRSQCAAPVFAVSTNNEEVGHIQGEQFNTLVVGDGGAVLYVEGPSASDAARKRTQGMLSAKRANIAVKALKGDWTEEGGYRAVSAWLRLSISKELHLRVIGCQNDAMALGARLAIQEIADNDERQKLLELPFTGCDGLPNKGQAFVDRGVLRATVVNPPLTGPALQMLAHAFAAKAQPAEHTLVSVSSYPPVEALRLKGTPA